MTGHRHLFWPLVLITVGLVFLLANLGYLGPVSVFALLSLWPLLLILAGIDIAFSRRWPLGTLAAEVIVIALGLIAVASQPALLSAGWVGFAVRDGEGGQSDVSVPHNGSQGLSLRVNGGAGTFSLAGGSTMLVESHSDRADLRLRRSERTGSRVEIRLDQGVSDGFHFGPRSSGTVDTKVASDVPMSLDLNYGAGQFHIDMRDIRVTDARINTGASSLEVDLPRPSGDVPITVNAGASSVVIVVPDGVEARITTTGAIVSMRGDNARISSGETSGYATSRDRVTIRVTAGASTITVR